MNEYKDTRKVKRGTNAINKAIVAFLSKRESATWRDLRDSLFDEPLRDSTLGQALDRLIHDHVVKPQAELRAGKATTLYTLGGTFPLAEAAKVNPLFIWWIDKNIRHLKDRQEREQCRGTGKPSEEKDRVPDLFGGLPDISEEQGEAVAFAIKYLGVTILAAVKEANDIHDEEERNKYLDRICSTYFNLLIGNIIYLASPACGNSEKAIEIAGESLEARVLLNRLSQEFLPGKPV